MKILVTILLYLLVAVPTSYGVNKLFDGDFFSQMFGVLAAFVACMFLYIGVTAFTEELFED